MSPEELLAALERARVGRRREGRVAVLDYGRARTRVFDVVFLLGLEEGACRAATARRRYRRGAAPRARGTARPADSVARDRYTLLHGLHASVTLVLVREAARRSRPREPRPVLARRYAALYGSRRSRATPAPRSLSLTWPIDAAPSERERLRAAAVSRSTTRTRPRPSPPRTAGRGASSARGRPSTDRRGSGRRARHLLGGPPLRDRARALRRLLVRLARRAHRGAEDDRCRAGPDPPGSGRAHGAQPLLRCCPRSSTRSATPRTSRPRSCSCGAASTTARSSRA